MAEAGNHVQEESSVQLTVDDEAAWAVSTRFLLKGDPHKALHWARKSIEGGTSGAENCLWLR